MQWFILGCCISRMSEDAYDNDGLSCERCVSSPVQSSPVQSKWSRR